MKIKGEMVLLNEPDLEFGYSQVSKFAKDGLLLFGPSKIQGQSSVIRYGVVGTTYGINLFKNWLGRINKVIPSVNPERNHFQYWPGFNAVFNAMWAHEPLVNYGVNAEKLSNAIRSKDHYVAIHDSVSLIEDSISIHLNEEDHQPDLWIVIVPDEIYRFGRPKSTVPAKFQTSSSGTMGKKAADRFLESGALFPELVDDAKIYQFQPDFHAQLKARLLGKAVLQIIRESTLNDGEYFKEGRLTNRRMQDPATTAWNLSTTVYFKSLGIPWRLADVRNGVCYIGLVYKVDSTKPTRENVCCGAQMFLDSGDGVVFRGAMGPWKSTDNREFHLSKEVAKELMKTVIDAYVSKTGIQPSEIFIHTKTNFHDEEWNGFKSAINNKIQLVGVKIRKTKTLRIYRAGRLPLLRGTALILDDRKAYLWSSGYVPRLLTYPGWEVPNPLEIEIQRGHKDIDTVLKDVLGLTKLNYNACIYGDSNPVTLRFADSVGTILTASPENVNIPLPFKFYI